MSFFNPDIPARLPLRTDQILGASLQLHQNEAAQALHLATFLTIPPTATLYTLAGVFPDSALAQQISPSDRWRFKSRVPILSAPRAWWDQLERMSWFALTQGRSGTPECNLGRVDFR